MKDSSLIHRALTAAPWAMVAAVTLGFGVGGILYSTDANRIGEVECLKETIVHTQTYEGDFPVEEFDITLEEVRKEVEDNRLLSSKINKLEKEIVESESAIKPSDEEGYYSLLKNYGTRLEEVKDNWNYQLGILNRASTISLISGLILEGLALSKFRHFEEYALPKKKKHF